MNGRSLRRGPDLTRTQSRTRTTSPSSCSIAGKQRWRTGDPSTWGPHHNGSHQLPSTLHTAGGGEEEGDPSTWGPYHDDSHQLPSTLHTAVGDGGPIHLGTTPQRLTSTPIHSTHSGGGGRRRGTHRPGDHTTTTHTNSHPIYTQQGGGGEEGDPSTWGPRHDDSHQLSSTLHTAVGDGGPIHLGTTPRRLIPTPIHSTHSGGGRGTHPPGDHTTTTHTNSHPLYTQQGGGGTGPNHLGTTPRRLTPTPIHSTHSGGGRGTHPPGDHTTTANTNSHPLYTQRWGTGDPSTWGQHHNGSHQPPSTLHTASVQSPTHHTATLQSPSPV